MARTELPNGVILPAEYSDDWYEDMTSNLTKLDDVIGSDSEKLNSNDVAFLRMSSAALTDGGTGNFSDLNSSNKLKTGDYVLDSGRKLYQVVSVDSTNETFTVGNSLFKITAESDLAPVAESGDYDDLDNKPDLNPYDQHIVNTDIHVTTADKNKWNNGVSQAYVFRYSSTALVASSTNSNTLLDNTDNLKVGDKVIDSSGVLFSITAIDTANSTFTIGSALVDLALDANVVHTSGNETISGVKTITDTNLEFKSTSAEYGVSAGDNSVIFKDKNNLQTFKIYSRVFSSGLDNNLVSFFLTQKVDNTYYISNGLQLFANTGHKNAILRPILANNNADGLSISLGDNNRRWQSVYATNYYYGSNSVEFSTKFVTTDTNQTISGTKTFSSINGVEPSSLSLPSDRSARVDISGYITNLGNGDNNSYTVPANGYVWLHFTSINSALCYSQTPGGLTNYSQTFARYQGDGQLYAFFPVRKNDKFVVQIYTSSTAVVQNAYFIPCQGNV